MDLRFRKSRRIVIAGTLDTKGDEIAYLKRLLEAGGADPLIVDVGVTGAVPFAPEVRREEIAQLAGKSALEMRSIDDRGAGVAAMETGFAEWVRRNAGDIAGILAVGGSGGTTIATSGMRELAIGVPKLMVSTVASGHTRGFVQSADIIMQNSVADLAGLNRFTRVILRNAAAAMLGMAGLSRTLASLDSVEELSRPLAGATMFGVTTPCVNHVRELLDPSGYEVLIFHANGAGGLAMERLARDGFLAGVLDITTAELAAELLGGHFSAGPQRMTVAGELGLPQVISVGGLDMVAFGPRDTVPRRYENRHLHIHNANVTLMRTNREENEQIGRELASKAALSKGPVSIVLPLRGVSALDAGGQAFEDKQADEALFAAIRRNSARHVRIVEVDAHINDAGFSERLAGEFLALAGAPQTMHPVEI